MQKSLNDELNRLAKKFHFESADEVQRLPHFSFDKVEIESPFSKLKQAIIDTKKEGIATSEIGDKKENIEELETENWKEWKERQWMETELLREHINNEKEKEAFKKSFVWDPNKPYKFPDEVDTSSHPAHANYASPSNAL